MRRTKDESDTDYLINRTNKVSRVDGMSECWEWTKALVGPQDGLRYGVFRRHGKNITAHRAAYEAFVGPIPAGALICHKCNNPRCCNPEHLYAGTYQSNADDMMAHGAYMAARPRRIKHSRAKLTEEDVAEIRHLASETDLTYVEIAARFGVDRSTVNRLALNDAWPEMHPRRPRHRNGGGRGERNKLVTLTQEQALEIKRLLASGRKGASLATEYNVAPSTITMIKQGVHWAVRGDSTMSGERDSS